MRPSSPRPTRRAFLVAAALAPVAVAQEAPVPAPASPPPREVTAVPAPPADPESLREIREFDVPLGTEPAFVFRALSPVAAPAGGSRR